MDINDELSTLIKYIAAMNLGNSETDMYPRNIEWNLCNFKNSLLNLKEDMSRLKKARLLQNANVPFMQSVSNFYQEEMLVQVKKINRCANLLPSAINANSYKDQITHIQTEWAKLQSFIEKGAWTLPMN